MGETPNNTPPIFINPVETKTGVSFDSQMVKDVQVTFFMDDDKDIVERVNGAFDILFEEVMKDRDMNRGKVEKS
jgi:hypothetical protein